MTVPLQTILRLSSGQHVRLQLAGSGPAVVMCHESPRSSSALLPLAARLTQQFTCVMVDTPGFGLSDPMPLSRPEIPDFAAVVLELIRKLELGPVPVYGTHTGAAIAVEAAVQAPDLVSAAILDGYAIFTEAERDDFLATYLTPFRPALDGTHVAWLWARVRDQFTAFPWNRVGDGSKLQFGPPTLERIQGVVNDFLLAGDAYRAGYAAAFRYDHYAPLKRTRVPIRLATREDDLLFEHMERARGLGGNVTLTAMSADRTEWADTIAGLVADHAGSVSIDAGTVLKRSQAHLGNSRLLNTSVGPVGVRIDGEGPDVVMLHDVPGGLADLDHVAERLARTHRAIRIGLPGTDVYPFEPSVSIELDALTAAVTEAIATLKASDAPVVASGASLPVAARLPWTHRLIALDPWPQVADQCDQNLPDLTPQWDGAHLASAFWLARDFEIYKPWFNRVNILARAIGNDRDLERIHNRFRSAVLAGERGTETARMLFAEKGVAEFEHAGRRVDVVVFDGDPDRDALTRWGADIVGPANLHTVSRQAGPLGDLLRELLA